MESQKEENNIEENSNQNPNAENNEEIINSAEKKEKENTEVGFSHGAEKKETNGKINNF